MKSRFVFGLIIANLACLTFYACPSFAQQQPPPDFKFPLKGSKSEKDGWYIQGGPSYTETHPEDVYSIDIDDSHDPTGKSDLDKVSTPVIAAASGKVIEEVRIPTGGGFGKYVVIEHKNGYQTLYAHLDNVSVRKGQVVKLGDKLGILGSTGKSTGPHLHFEVRYKGSNRADELKGVTLEGKEIMNYKTGQYIMSTNTTETERALMKAQNKAEYIASLKGQFIETLKGIPKAFDDLEHGRLEGILPQTLYDVSTSLLQTIAAVTPAGFSLSLSDLEKMQKTLDSTRSVANLDPGHPDLNVLASTLTPNSTSAAVVEVSTSAAVVEVSSIGYYTSPYASSFSSGGYYIPEGPNDFGVYISDELQVSGNPAFAKRYGDVYKGIVTNSILVHGHSLGTSTNSVENADVTAINNTNPVQGDDFFTAIYQIRTGPAFIGDVSDFRNYFTTDANDPPHEYYDTLKWKYGVEP